MPRCPVATDSLNGQLADAGFVTSTAQIAGHIFPINASVQGPRFVGMLAPLVGAPTVSQPITVVSQVALPPVHAVASTSDSFVPAFVVPGDGRSFVPFRPASSVPPAPSVRPAPPAPSVLPAQSASPHPWICNGVPQFIQRPSGPGTTGAPSVIDNVGQAAVGNSYSSSRIHGALGLEY